MSIKYIHIDYRVPKNKAETRLYGQAEVDDNTASVYINRRLHRNGRNLADTFFHEMVHVFVGFHGKEGQMSDAKEERLAQEIGRLCAEALK